MEHLTLETLARLLDGVPSEHEARHLAGCRICQEELAALKDQTEALGALPALRPPQGDWEALEARLLSEGLLGSQASDHVHVFPLRRNWRMVTQAAAAIVLFVGGTAIGSAMSSEAPQETGTSLALAASGAQQANSAVTLTTMDEAANEVRRTEQAYIEAMVRYRELARATGRNIPETQDPATHYAALGAVMAASQAAVREAPADPFLNGILASVTAERQAYFQTLSGSNRETWY